MLKSRALVGLAYLGHSPMNANTSFGFNNILTRNSLLHTLEILLSVHKRPQLWPVITEQIPTHCLERPSTMNYSADHSSSHLCTIITTSKFTITETLVYESATYADADTMSCTVLSKYWLSINFSQWKSNWQWQQRLHTTHHKCSIISYYYDRTLAKITDFFLVPFKQPPTKMTPLAFLDNVEYEHGKKYT